jgi:hypothetical protein
MRARSSYHPLHVLQHTGFSPKRKNELAASEAFCHADPVNGSPRQSHFVIFLALLALAGFGVDTMAAAPTTTPAPGSLPQLHAAFRESQRCMQERIMIRAIAYNPNGARPSTHIPGCDDMQGALRQVYEATNAAAKAGDLDAQMCYLAQHAGDRESGFRLSDEEVAEYQKLGPKYVEAAFKRGDWRIVALLGFHVVDSAGLFIGLEQWKDPLREYKANQLLRLVDVDPQRTDYRLATASLSAQEMRDADAWAQQTYDKYFISQPKLLKEPQVCTAQDAN